MASATSGMFHRSRYLLWKYVDIVGDWFSSSYSIVMGMRLIASENTYRTAQNVSKTIKSIIIVATGDYIISCFAELPLRKLSRIRFVTVRPDPARVFAMSAGSAGATAENGAMPHVASTVRRREPCPKGKADAGDRWRMSPRVEYRS